MFRRSLSVITAMATLTVATACARSEAIEPDAIVALERAALDRWGRGDPQGYLEAYATDVTYFDPQREKRLDGLETMKRVLEPITGLVKVDSYEMVDPRVQLAGEAAILTYNLVSHARRPDGAAVDVRWNSTAVYAQVDGRWKIRHSHWSFTQPDLKTPAGP